MSTKISHGYRLPKLTLDELHLFCQKARTALRDQIKTSIAKAYAIIGQTIIDSQSLHLPNNFQFGKNKVELNGSIQNCVGSILCAAQHEIKMSKRRDQEFDFQCDFTIHVLPDKILCLFYAEQDEFVQVWESLPEVQEYRYCNNTDRPQNITEVEWERRGNEWDATLKNDHFAPALNSFIVQCSHEHDISPIYLDLKVVISQIPSIEERLITFATQQYQSEWLKQKITDESPPIHLWVEALENWQKHLKTPDGKNKLAELIYEMRPKLIHPITSEHFKLPINSTQHENNT